MPLYEYECEQCHKRVEKIQKFSDGPLTICPHCGGSLERTLTAPAVQFKGSGWYKDLYSSPKPSAATGSGGDGAASSGSSESNSGGTSESKPAAATATPPASAPAATTSSGNSGS